MSADSAVSDQRFSAEQYNRFTAIGAFTTDDRMELLDGFLVSKEKHSPLAATVLGLLEDEARKLLQENWIKRVQHPIYLTGDNVPEPDLAIVKGPIRRYAKHHPYPSDIALLGEVAETTLDQDRGIKPEMYARDRIPEYWIINLVDNVVEVYTQPKGGRTPSYRQMVSRSWFIVPLRIAGKELGEIGE
jgi:Uma2 family endonuclease